MYICDYNPNDRLIMSDNRFISQACHDNTERCNFNKSMKKNEGLSFSPHTGVEMEAMCLPPLLPQFFILCPPLFQTQLDNHI